MHVHRFCRLWRRGRRRRRHRRLRFRLRLRDRRATAIHRHGSLNRARRRRFVPGITGSLWGDRRGFRGRGFGASRRRDRRRVRLRLSGLSGGGCSWSRSRRPRSPPRVGKGSEPGTDSRPAWRRRQPPAPPRPRRPPNCAGLPHTRHPRRPSGPRASRTNASGLENIETTPCAPGMSKGRTPRIGRNSKGFRGFAPFGGDTAVLVTGPSGRQAQAVFLNASRAAFRGGDGGRREGQGADDEVARLQGVVAGGRRVLDVAVDAVRYRLDRDFSLRLLLLVEPLGAGPITFFSPGTRSPGALP